MPMNIVRTDFTLNTVGKYLVAEERREKEATRKGGREGRGSTIIYIQ